MFLNINHKLLLDLANHDNGDNDDQQLFVVLIQNYIQNKKNISYLNGIEACGVVFHEPWRNLYHCNHNLNVLVYKSACDDRWRCFEVLLYFQIPFRNAVSVYNDFYCRTHLCILVGL